MSAANRATAFEPEPDERQLTITRILDAPRELVFKVWTQPEHVVRWMGPIGFTTPSCQMDVRPGGTYRTLIRSCSRSRGRTRKAIRVTRPW
jgi:uncharacterized protein YndB with AHSA1/START domain